MEKLLMNLKVMLPYRVFAEIKQINRIVVETSEGFYGFLPKRMDCVAALVPGIFMYETASDGVHYLAVDEGIMVKTGREVLVSVRNAIGGVDLGMLQESAEKEFKTLDENERNTRTVMAKMVSGLIYSLEKFRKD